MHKKLVIANWKLNGNFDTCDSLIQIKEDMHAINDVDKVICSPNTYLNYLSNNLKDSNILLGAQNSAAYATGAYTGEVSAQMLQEIGCKYVIIGHSERRSLFNETDDIILNKIKLAINYLTPVVCIGESFDDYQNNNTMHVLMRQIGLLLESEIDLSKVVIAYEPIYAIGTNIVPAANVISEIFTRLKAILPTTKLLYGGSVKDSNIGELSRINNIDGFLVGGASLPPINFLNLIKLLSK